MNISEAAAQLGENLGGQEWFVNVGTSNYNSLIVYTKWQTIDILKEIPDKFAGYQVCVHFAPKQNPVVLEPQQDNISIPTECEIEYTVNDLIRELDRLERECGSNILQDIFYEVQDGKNAVTNLSSRYPDVRRSMEDLFDKYGFDVIYEELDG